MEFRRFLEKTEEKPEETKIIPLQKNLVVAIKNGIGWRQVWLRFWNDDVFNPDITEPTLKPIASNESNSSEKPAQTNIIKTTENQDINNNSNTIKLLKTT